MDLRPLLSVLETVTEFVDEGVILAEPSGGVAFHNRAAAELLALTEPLKRLKDMPGISFHKELLKAGIDAGEVDAAGRPSGRFLGFEVLRERGGAVASLRFRSGLIEVPGAKAPLRLVLIRDVTAHRRGEANPLPEGTVVTNDPRMEEILVRIRQVAPTTASLLVLGESGTGKTRIARMIHALSQRAQRPFIEVNCAAIPETLIESELFGHVKGAFTGALHDRPGRFQSAHRGTLFLDEVTEIPLNVQAKLLRALQDQEFEMVGSDKTVRVDVRVIAASNRDPKEMLESGALRADLYYRLAVIPLEIPPLRERPGDIPRLIEHFRDTLAARGYSRDFRISQRAMGALLDYHWPGNVRELENAIEHGVICAENGVVQLDSLPADVRRARNPVPPPTGAAKAAPAETDEERARILHALQEAGGNRALAASLLEVDRTTLWRRMVKLNIRA